MSVYMTRLGIWYVEHRPCIPGDPKGRTKIYCGKGEEGERKARELHTSLGLDKATRAADKLGPTVNKVLTKYMQSRIGHMAETTASATDYCIQAHLSPFFGRYSAYNLTSDILDQYVNSRLQPQTKRGRKLPDGSYEERTVHIKKITIRRELSILKAAMSWASKTKPPLIITDPIKDYELPEKDAARHRPPSPQEVQKLIDNAAPHLVRALTVSWYTGIRVGASELLALKWEHVNLDGDTIFVVSADKGGPSEREVPLHEEFRGQLEIWREEDRALSPVPEYIIHYHGRPITRIKTAWNAAKRRAGITRPMKPYSLRHAAATWMLKGGADLKSVSKILGHSDVATTASIYQHIDTEMKRSAVNTLPGIKRKKK